MRAAAPASMPAAAGSGRADAPAASVS